MELKLLNDYARLIAKIGGNIQKGDIVWINANLDQPDFVAMVIEECYKLGAKEVDVDWQFDKHTRLNYKYQTTSNLGMVNSYTIAKFKYQVKKLPTRIYLISDDPDAYKGLSASKMAKVRVKRYGKIKKYRDAMDAKYKWCIAAVPSKAWAKKVFPKLNEEEAVEKLWENILLTSRVDGNDPVDNWNKHNEELTRRKKQLMELKLSKLVYKSSNGTDFTVELIPNMAWGAGIESAPGKGTFNPNIPSEEVFTTPMRGKAEGTVVASKPLSYQGQLIEDFYLKFQNGRVVEVFAKKNKKLLEKMVSMDENAGMLGEVALVPYDSPISNSGILFYETLFDENAACHLALGAGFPELYPGAIDMSKEEQMKIGINDSIIHVDFMIGTKDLSIVGIDEKGNETQIFKDGNWAF